jgi:hypothetical protein
MSRRPLDKAVETALLPRIAVITGLKPVLETNSIALCHVERSLPQLRDCRGLKFQGFLDFGRRGDFRSR